MEDQLTAAAPLLLLLLLLLLSDCMQQRCNAWQLHLLLLLQCWVGGQGGQAAAMQGRLVPCGPCLGTPTPHTHSHNSHSAIVPPIEAL